MPYDRNGSRPVDNYILDYLVGGKTIKRVWSDKDMGYLGTVAFLYDLPELFTEAFRSINVGNIQIDNLVGIGFGLLSKRIYKKEV